MQCKLISKHKRVHHQQIVQKILLIHIYDTTATCFGYYLQPSSGSRLKSCTIFSLYILYSHNYTLIQGMHKRMVRFQKLTRNLFRTLHRHNVHRQQRQLSKFPMRYQQFASHAYCAASLQDGVAAGKGFLCAPF